jgi:hypothetical protein
MADYVANPHQKLVVVTDEEISEITAEETVE